MQSAENLRSLTTLRGIAALWVLAHNDLVFRHSSEVDKISGLFTKGYLGVDFFLVLSGFVLAYVYALPMQSNGKRLDPWRFVGLRLARIYPLYVFLLSIRGSVEAAKLFVEESGSFRGPAPFSDQNSVAALFANLLMVQAWGFFDGPT